MAMALRPRLAVAYGQRRAITMPPAGVSYSQTVKNAFVALTARFLQINPGADPPLTPPARVYGGDSVEVTVAAVPGGVAFEAGWPNADGSDTKLLLQRLANPRRAPGPQYKSARFVRFETGSLRVVLPVEPGVWACATRFVAPATGEAAGFAVHGVVEVA